MSKKIKKRNDSNKVTHNNLLLKYPVFCFKYLTTNKEYNLEYFKNDKTGKLNAYEKLFEKISLMSSTNWVNFFNLNKRNGLETIEFKYLNFSSSYVASKDDKFISIRFDKKNDYRIIGIKSEKNKDVIHVLGFDFNHSAYNH